MGLELQKPAPARAGNCFDFLRLFAAVTVVVSHSVEHLRLSFLWLVPHGRFWFYDGVALFFILSGFLVYRSCKKCLENDLPVWNFYTNRFLRVAPAIYVYAVIAAVLLLGIGAV